MARWKRVETYLAEHDNEGTEFTVSDYAEAEGIKTAQASLDIQRYLTAQRRKNSRVRYVLHRKPGTRTTKTKWLVGDKTKDAMQIGDVLLSDIRTKVMRTFAPDLTRLATLNPRAAKRVKRQLNSMVEHMVPLLENAVLGESEEDE